MGISEQESNQEGRETSGQTEEDDEKPRTLFVGNVPREVHKREIEEVFGEIGPLKRCYIQYSRGGNEKKKQHDDVTVAYVTFALSQDATNALETLQGTKLGNNRINIKFAKTRSEQVRPPVGGDSKGRFQRSANLEPIAGATPQFKEPRPKPIKKKSRLIIRNLSFAVTDDKLKEYFQQCGDIKDVNILKKPNGKLVGCAFIQYQNVFQAAKAIKELNLKPFLGRPIAIDWALPKNTYQTDEEKNRPKEEANEQNSATEPSDTTIEIKDEPESEMEDNSSQFDASDPYNHLKDEPMDTSDIKVETKIEPLSTKRKYERHSEEDSDDDDRSEIDRKQKRQKTKSNDVEEGKTLFIRNLPFDISENELKTFFEKYGDLHYALLCKDSLTEHPKGTGFVKYKEKSSADKCLQDYEEDPEKFMLNHRQMNVSVAISKEKIVSRPPKEEGDKSKAPGNNNNNKPKSDGRNLYLVREGFIRPGSGAAADVSVSDMHKRASLNQVKKQMLKNLNIFISPTRLCVHNLPPSFSDKTLKKLFAKYAGPGAKITEAKIMRDMKDIDLNGKGKSKGFGFVNFTEHEHALTALRAVNNNPEILNPNNRPIVEFSLENRLALKAKEKRALKSKEKNPNAAKYLKKEAADSDDEADEDTQQDEDDNETNETKTKKKKKGEKNQAKPDSINAETEDVAPKYAGLVAKKGVQSVPSFKPKGKITRNSLKPRKTKKMKKIEERRLREKKIPSKRVDKIDKAEKLINKHRSKMNAESGFNESSRKKKWYA